MTENPLISVIVPCYNQGIFLSQALNSILGQTYPNWECVIINDGSTDEQTDPIAQSFADADQRFTYIKQPNAGVSAARNAGLEKIKGDYLLFLDADDWVDLRLFEKGMGQVGDNDLILCQTKVYHNEIKQYAAYYSDLTRADLSFSGILKNWAVDFDIPIHSALISTNIFNRFCFIETIDIAEDWIMWLSLFKQQPRVAIIDEPLAFYRKWPNSATQELNKAFYHEFYAVQYIIDHFEIDNFLFKMLNERLFRRLIKQVEFLDDANRSIKNSTSFRLSYNIISKLKPFFSVFNTKRSADRIH